MGGGGFSTDRCRVKGGMRKRERWTGQPTTSESKAEKCPLLLPVITVPLLKCQCPSVCASVFKGVNSCEHWTTC